MMDSPLEYGNVFPTPSSILEADYGERSGEKKNYEKKLFVCRVVGLGNDDVSGMREKNCSGSY